MTVLTMKILKVNIWYRWNMWRTYKKLWIIKSKRYTNRNHGCKKRKGIINSAAQGELKYKDYKNVLFVTMQGIRTMKWTEFKAKFII